MEVYGTAEKELGVLGDGKQEKALGRPCLAGNRAVPCTTAVRKIFNWQWLKPFLEVFLPI